MKKSGNLLLILFGCFAVIFLTAGKPDIKWETHHLLFTGKNYYIDMPIGFEQKTRVLTDNLTPPPFIKGDGDRYEFLYPDSILVYAHKGNIFSMPNEGNYTSIGWSADKGKDTDTTISGTQHDGTLWKEVYLKDVIIGYKNVPATQKEVYDQALESFRKKKKLK